MFIDIIIPKRTDQSIMGFLSESNITLSSAKFESFFIDFKIRFSIMFSKIIHIARNEINIEVNMRILSIFPQSINLQKY